MLYLFLACSSPSAPPPKAPEAPKEAPKPAAPDLYDLSSKAANTNVILISVDCLRYDHTGLDPKNHEATPHLVEFAKSAVVFRNAQSAASWTVPSHMSIWTARFPTHHGLINKLAIGADGKMGDAALAANVPTFPEKLIASGWKGAAFTGDAGVSARFGFGRGGFEVFLDDQKFGTMEHSGPAADQWVQNNKDGHFFLFFHGYDTHGQASLPPSVDPRSVLPSYKGKLDGGIEEQARLREQGLSAIKNPGDMSSLAGVIDEEDNKFLTAIYDKKIELADQRVGSFLDLLHTTGLWDKSIVVILSDHGEEFMERGALDHGQTLFQEQLHVPMMIHFPGQTQGVEITDPALTLNIFPTLFDALGLPAIPEADGQSLLPLIRGTGPAPGPLLSESDYRLFVHLRSLRKGNYKIILNLGNGKVSLYDLATDPGEKNDIAAAQPKIAYEMEQELRAKILSFGTDPASFLNLNEEHIKIF